MSDEASPDTTSGVDLFFWCTTPFGMEFTLALLHINEFHPKRGRAPRKGHHLLFCLFSITPGPNRHQARVRCHIAFVYRVKRLYTVVLTMLAD